MLSLLQRSRCFSILSQRTRRLEEIRFIPARQSAEKNESTRSDGPHPPNPGTVHSSTARYWRRVTIPHRHTLSDESDDGIGRQEIQSCHLEQPRGSATIIRSVFFFFFCSRRFGFLWILGAPWQPRLGGMESHASPLAVYGPRHEIGSNPINKGATPPSRVTTARTISGVPTSGTYLSRSTKNPNLSLFASYRLREGIKSYQYSLSFVASGNGNLTSVILRKKRTSGD